MTAGAARWQQMGWAKYLRALGQMDYLAADLGATEAQLSADDLKRLAADAGVPLISANLVGAGGTPLVAPYRQVTVNFLRVTILGVVQIGAGDVLGAGVTAADIDQRAVDGLVRVGQKNAARKAAGAVLEIALDDADRNVRLLAVGAMAKIDQVNVARLVGLLGDESMEVRATVLRVLGRSGNKAAAVHIAPLLEDSEWRIRAAALEVLGELLDEEGRAPMVPAVAARLSDPDGFVRARAAALIRLAGFAPEALAEAALLQLGTAPVAERLARQALSWQQSPRRDLARWVRQALHRQMGLRRLVRLPADLSAPSTRPAR